jgi:uncharacterized membrane protein YphA (DoxX/SURF4 family)
MNIALWIVQGLLAVVFLMAGAMKILKPKDEAMERMPFVEDFSEPVLKTIGVLEVAGAIGLILPGITGIAPVLVPLAATGLAIIQAGAVVVHTRRGEAREIAMNVVLFALSVFVAWGRFGDYSL